MITNSEPGYFRALIPFERDPLRPATPASEHREGLGVRHRSLLQSRGVGSAQPPDSGPLLAGAAPRSLSLSVISSRSSSSESVSEKL